MPQSPFSADSSVGQILTYLQRHGEATIRDLEQELGISTTAVREHLTNLDARGYIGTRLVRNGRGRPHIVYSLTEQARDLFPRSYDTLMTVLFDEIARQQGSDALKHLLDSVSERLAESYPRTVRTDIESRLVNVQRMMQDQGIPVEVRAAEHEFTFYACPYHEVAQDHADVCAMERRMLEQVLGHTVETDSAIREGGRCCNFSVARGSGPSNTTITLTEK
jgi:DeoR family suf operon transcriptional repressor